MCSITGEGDTLSITGAGIAQATSGAGATYSFTGVGAAGAAACEDHITSAVSSQSEEQECPRFAPRSARGRVPERSLDNFPQSASGFEGSARAQLFNGVLLHTLNTGRKRTNDL